MKHLGLFEGIGGFSLAARWMGWETVAWVEIDPFCQKVLLKNFPDAKGHGDIREFDGNAYKGKIDILTGGFPCQPFSEAGKRKGDSDSRYLWDSMLQTINQVKPTWVVAENVFGLTTIERGLVFAKIETDMENEGYEVQSFIIPSCSVNAPHKRDRVWIIAYAKGMGCKNGDAENIGKASNKINPPKNEGVFYTPKEWGDFETVSVASRFFGNDDGLPNRVDRNMSLGNAIVPQVAYRIFETINAFNFG